MRKKTAKGYLFFVAGKDNDDNLTCQLDNFSPRHNAKY